MSERIDRRGFLKYSGLSALSVAISSLTAGAVPLSVTDLKDKNSKSKPNFIIIYVDDLDFDEVNLYDIKKFPCHTGMKINGYYAGKKSQHDFFDDTRMLMPNLEQLAREGVKANRFYITSASCVPSRYSILTGRYASRSPISQKHFPADEPASITNQGMGLSSTESNLPKALQACGYKTGIVGKWHLGDVTENPEELAKANPNDPKDNAKIREAQRLTCESFKKHGFDFAESIYTRNVGTIRVPKQLRHNNLEWITQGAINFLDRHNKSPFFLYMALVDPHSQYYDAQNRRKGGGKWWDEDARACPGGLMDKVPDCMPCRKDVIRRVDEAGIPRVNSMATWIDDSLGAIMKKLEELDLVDNTVLIFTSDHQSRGKFSVYEGARVPFVVRWPGKIKGGRSTDTIFANIDMAPTFLEWAGCDKSLPGVGRDGESIAKILTGDLVNGSGRKSLLLESCYMRGVVTSEWKYIACRAPDEVLKFMDEDAKQAAQEKRRRHVGWDGKINTQLQFGDGVKCDTDRDFPNYFDADQLYNLEEDPFEQINLANDPKYRYVLKNMKALLQKHLETLPNTFGEFKKKA